MIGRAFLPLVLASAVFAVLLGPSAAQSACCSQSHRTCESWTAKTYADCQKQNDGKLVWLPQGPETKTCFQRGNNTSCKVHNDCCGTLVCESVGWNFRIKQCQHPIDACAVYNRDPVRCNTKSSCVFRDSKCVPNFNFTIKDPLTLPKDILDDPACCSQNFRNCTMWSPQHKLLVLMQLEGMFGFQEVILTLHALIEEGIMLVKFMRIVVQLLSVMAWLRMSRTRSAIIRSTCAVHLGTNHTASQDQAACGMVLDAFRTLIPP